MPRTSSNARPASLGFGKAARSVLSGAALCASLFGLACSSSKELHVEPFDCEFVSNSGFPLDRPSMTGEIDLDFTDHEYGHGTAPKRLKGMVTSAGPDLFTIAACGRDSEDREWQIAASWNYLPQPYPAQYPLDFPAGPRWTGTAGAEMGLPGFGVTLELCGRSCSTREWLAYDGPYYPNSSIKGSAHIDAYDFCTGRFKGSGELAHTSLSHQAIGPMSIAIDTTWTPSDEIYVGLEGETHPVNTICPTGNAGGADSSAGDEAGTGGGGAPGN